MYLAHQLLSRLATTKGREMPWIRTVPPAEATGVLKEAYDWQGARLGAPAEFTQLGSLYPEIVLERLRLYRVVDGAPSGLSPAERYQAALVTSLINGTVHCASGLRIRLEELQVSPDDVELIVSGASLPPGNERLSAILGYAYYLTRDPGGVVREQVDALRTAGVQDLDILDLNNIVAYYNYINRVANGLGLHTPIPERRQALQAVPVGADPRAGA
jgi:uncharacterized peroxidase-related enzyme